MIHGGDAGGRYRPLHWTTNTHTDPLFPRQKRPVNEILVTVILIARES